MKHIANSVNLSKPLISFLFFFLLFTYPLISFLWRRSYPLFTIETATLFALAVVASVFLAVILLKVRQSIANVLLSILITVSLMVQFNLLLEGVIFCLVISLVLTWQFESKFYVYGLPILAAMILGALFDGSKHGDRFTSGVESVNVDAELPPVIHILLDAFSGTNGFPPYPASTVIKEEVSKFFKNYGFQIFPSAYSRYARTGDSLYSAMNFKNDGNSEFALEAEGRREHVLKSNALFESLEEIGYRINIYQTGHLDFCQSNLNNLDRCWNYTHPYVKSLRQVKNLKLRTKALTGVLLKQSTLLADLFESRSWFLDIGVTNHDPRVFSNLQNDILKEADGRYFFAHVLLPHGPFAYTHNCSVNYETSRVIRSHRGLNEPVLIDIVYEARTGLYFEQMECSLLSLRKIFDNMRKTRLFERSIIVIHGDHGSLIGKNIAKYQNFENLTPLDYRSNFSTLFAVKFPNGNYQENDQVLSLSVLFEEFSAAVRDYATNQGVKPSELKILTKDPAKLDTYVFLVGTYPLYRVDINIFDN